MKKDNNKNKIKGDAISYSGSVEITLVRGDKVVKKIKSRNKGKVPLFRFLASALTGNYNEHGAPRYIRLGYKEPDGGGIVEDGVDTTQVTTNAIPYSTTELSVDDSGEVATASFKFLVPFSSVPSGKQINIIRLYNSQIEWDNNIAYFIIPSEDIINSDGKSNILLVWSMSIKNS